MSSSSTRRIALIHGPNLQWLGRREPEIYGTTTLPELESRVTALAAELGVTVECYQENSEGALLDTIYALKERGIDELIVNAGAYTHTSVALRDALTSVEARFVEVHISNVYRREDFRHVSYLSDIAAGVIVGMGVGGYDLALRWLVESER